MDTNRPLDNLTDSSMQNLKKLVDVNTIIGDPIKMEDGTTIIPVSKVSFGFGSGGSEFASQKPQDLFGGGSGGGVTMQPIAFLVTRSGGEVQLLQLASNNNVAERAINMMPDMVDKISGLFSKNKDQGAQ